ncbi:glycosyltransferase family 2 protein [Carboxylicivirga marina]|uniref:glycosyltransferase family 2 protein n=1 Tax=Carboxylicivirga marina TaxID=2800988 RepID=UPI00259A482D|nr:glycosyltransferase family 2 protein [uncultured Carboxylicivirga sp.]
MALVSILIPLYNSESYIAETIQSALNQTWPNIEIIIVDDGSTDNSYVIAKGFESTNVKVYQQQNSGACNARNYAFYLSTGEYIQYLDADDLLAPDKIEQQMQLFNQFGNSIVVSGIWGRFYESIQDVQWEEQVINKDYLSPINWLMDSWYGGGMAQTSIWLAPRHLIQNAGPWNEALKINQDGEFFSRVVMQADTIKFSANAKVYYRSGNVGSVSQSNKNRDKAASLLFSYRLYKENVKQYHEQTIKKALGNNFLNFIYQYQSSFPDLCMDAEKEFKALNVGKIWPVGGRRFQQMAKIIGFKNALKIKNLTS